MFLARLLLLTVSLASIAVGQAPTAAPAPAAANQEYLVGRKAETAGDIAAATASYQALVSRNSILKEYALWRLARIARSTGDLVLERERLQQLITTAPSSLLYDSAALRLSES